MKKRQKKTRNFASVTVFLWAKLNIGERREIPLVFMACPFIGKDDRWGSSVSFKKERTIVVSES